MYFRCIALFLVLAFIAACSEEASTPDSGSDVAVIQDQNAPVDEGSVIDEGSPIDEGGPIDEGTLVDEGSVVDEGFVVDEGGTVDLSSPVDEGSGGDSGGSSDSAVAVDDGAEADNAGPDVAMPMDVITLNDPGVGSEPDMVIAEACPPQGPYGAWPPATLADAALIDCDGNPYSLHDLCPRKASMLFVYAQW